MHTQRTGFFQNPSLCWETLSKWGFLDIPLSMPFGIRRHRCPTFGNRGWTQKTQTHMQKNQILQSCFQSRKLSRMFHSNYEYQCVIVRAVIQFEKLSQLIVRLLLINQLKLPMSICKNNDCKWESHFFLIERCITPYLILKMFIAVIYK